MPQSPLLPSSRSKNESSSPHPKKYWLLSLDGGGERGVLHLATLAELERRTGKRIVDMFDGIAGTSIGGIMATLLTMPDPDDPTKPKYSPQQLLDIFFACRYEIFQPKWFSFNGILRTKYKTSGMKGFLARMLGGNTFKNRWLPTVLVTHDLYTYNMRLFSTIDQEDFYAKDLAMATAAAPTYYKPQHVFPINISAFPGYFVSDGGTCMNNPTQAGIALLHKHYNAALENIHVLSLGTGISNATWKNDALRRGGGLRWLGEFSTLFMCGQQNADINITTLFLGHRYHRFNPLVSPINLTFDNLSDENGAALLKANEEMLEEHTDRFNKVVELLIKAAEEKPARTVQSTSLIVLPQKNFLSDWLLWVRNWCCYKLTNFWWLRK